MTRQTLIASWVHADGTQIDVYDDHKVRHMPGNRVDHWPVLYRRDVPTLSDEDWIAMPASEGWQRLKD
jgi:hypothetical protein